MLMSAVTRSFGLKRSAALRNLVCDFAWSKVGATRRLRSQELTPDLKVQLQVQDSGAGYEYPDAHTPFVRAASFR